MTQNTKHESITQKYTNLTKCGMIIERKYKVND